MISDQQSALRRVAGAARHAALRVRLNETLERSFRLSPVPLLYAVAALTLIKVLRPTLFVERVLVAGAVALALAWLIHGLVIWFERRPRHYGALALDRHHALSDRISSALSFSELPEGERTPLMRAAIDDALHRAGELAPRRAVPLRLPGELWVAVLLCASLAGILLLEVRTERVIAPARSIEPLVMTGDDLDLFRALGQELAQKSKDPEASAAAARFNQLIEDVAQRRLDRSEVFRRLEEIERMLAKGAEADKEALEQGLSGLAQELGQADLSKPVAVALKQKQLADAEKAMKELAEKLARAKDKPNKQELEKLRRAMEAAAKSSSERSKAIEQKRQELEQQKKRLLNKDRDGGISPKDQAELDKNERQLERLNREKDQASRAQRQLSELDKALADAARDLMQEMGKSAEDLERAAEDLNRMQRQQMTQQEKERLRQRLQELRELLRQQGKGGQQRMARMQRFGERARGGRPGEGSQGQGDKGQQGNKGKGQQGQDGQEGQGQGQKGEIIGLGAGGDKELLMPGMQGSGQQGQGDKPGGGGNDPGGKSYGTGHDSNLSGDRSDLKGSTKDVSAAAQDTGEGAASSEVIYGAAERGFTGRGYQKVYTDYKTVAEQVMSEDEIPAGYRFYVQRYFQLIRPRE